MRTTRTLLVGLAASAMAFCGIGAAASASTKPHVSSRAAMAVVVGYENFTESQLMATIYGNLLTAAGFKVSYKNSGTRTVAVPALEAGSLGVLPEYAGSLAIYLDKTAHQQ